MDLTEPTFSPVSPNHLNLQCHDRTQCNEPPLPTGTGVASRSSVSSFSRNLPPTEIELLDELHEFYLMIDSIEYLLRRTENPDWVKKNVKPSE